MQGQPGLAVDMYEFLSELITGLCETKEYSSADHGSRRHAITLQSSLLCRWGVF